MRGVVGAERVRRVTEEIVALQPDIIFTAATPTTRAVIQQTRTIPTIFVLVIDPVGAGFVSNLSHPGNNATGFTNLEPTISTKWLELLKEIAPGINRVALLFNPATSPSFQYYLTPFKEVAPSLGVQAIAGSIRDTVRNRNGLRVCRTRTKWRTDGDARHLFGHPSRRNYFHSCSVSNFQPYTFADYSPIPGGCVPTTLTCTTSFGAPQRMSIRSSMDRKRASCRFKPRLNLSW